MDFSKTTLHIASIVVHHGEEPVLGGENGVCNVFFSGCNLQCVYCQNHQISHRGNVWPVMATETAVQKIVALLDSGVTAVGFVSPSHRISEMLFLIERIESLGHHPVWIYNSNGFDSVRTLKKLDGIINIYLPDFKYAPNALSKILSGVDKYAEVSSKALKEMYFQKGAALKCDEHGVAFSGMIIRHLVLPGLVENSIGVLELIAEQLSPNIAISLMAQYNPTPNVANHPTLSRTITAAEYQKVTDAFDRLGFSNGWIQELASHEVLNPDFTKESPFTCD